MNLVVSFEYTTRLDWSRWEPAIVCTEMPNFSDELIYRFLQQQAPDIKAVRYVNIFVGSETDYYNFIGLEKSVDNIRRIMGSTRARHKRFGEMLADVSGVSFVSPGTKSSEPTKADRVIVPCVRCRYFTPADPNGFLPRSNGPDGRIIHAVGVCGAPLPPIPFYTGWHNGRVLYPEKANQGCLLGEE